MATIDTAATSCRSLLLYMQSKQNGMLYRVNEYILVKAETSGNEQIVQVIDYFAMHHANRYHIFVKGKLFCASEENLTHLYSGSVIVVPTSEILFAPAINILRKLMLYPADETSSPIKYVVIDYLRPNIGISAEDVVVPIYPEVNDMLKVCGSNNEVWYAHVRTIDDKSKTCQVNFYVEDEIHQGKYHRETVCRRSAETIRWDSILGLADGYWTTSDKFWYSNS